MSGGERSLNEDIAASYCFALALHPMHRQVRIEGLGTGFNMEGMKIGRGKNDLKELIKHLIQSITKPAYKAQGFYMWEGECGC